MNTLLATIVAVSQLLVSVFARVWITLHDRRTLLCHYQTYKIENE